MPQLDGGSLIVEAVRFAAEPYLLEGELAYADLATSGREEGEIRGGVVLAGSHPLLGGTMHNNVVRGLGDGLAERGWASVRFNYRGVGRSEGPRVDVARHMAEFWQTSHVAGEMDLWKDVGGAVRHLRSIVEKGPLVFIGYSFGCALLPAVCREVTPEALVLIAPPLSKHDYNDFTTIQSPLLAIVSDNDFTLEPQRLHEWFNRLPEPKQLVRATLDNHFFRGHEPWLVETVAAFLQEHVR